MSPPNSIRAVSTVTTAGGSKVFSGSWDEYRMHVVQSLARIDDTLTEVKRDVTSLRIKVAIWSAAFGFAGASIPIVLDTMLRWWEIAAR